MRGPGVASLTRATLLAAPPAAPKRLRRALPEPLSIFDREAPEMGESPSPCDFADAFFPLRPPQRIVNFFKAGIAQVAHRRGAAEIAEILEQGSPRDAGRLGDVRNRNRRTQIGLHVVDGAS